MAVSSVKLQQTAEVLRRMGAICVVVFGSAAESPQTAVEADFAVEGISRDRVVEAVAAANKILGVHIALFTCDENPALYKLVVRFGRVLYQKPRPAAPHPF